MTQSRAPIHIAGHGRSGTTILGELFEGVDGFRVVYERSAVAMKWGHVGAEVGGIPALQQWVANQSRGGKRLVDKEPRNIFRLSALCEATGGVGLHIHRDGRDVACSVVRALAKRGRTLRQWLELRRQHADGTGLPSELVEELAAESPRVAVARTWALYETQARALWRDVGSMLVALVSYEQLLAAPATEAERIATWVGATADQKRHLVRRATRLLTDDPKGHVAQASRALHDDKDRVRRVGRWRDEFTEEEKQRLCGLCRRQYRELGYASWED